MWFHFLYNLAQKFLILRKLDVFCHIPKHARMLNSMKFLQMCTEIHADRQADGDKELIVLRNFSKDSKNLRPSRVRDHYVYMLVANPCQNHGQIFNRFSVIRI